MLPCFSSSRSIAARVAASATAAYGTAAGRRLPAIVQTQELARHSSSTSTNRPPSGPAASTQPAAPARRLKIPNAKAKAQASRALRQQVAGLAAAESVWSSESASPAAPHPLRDVVAYATAEAYDFDALIRSGRLPAGWSLLEDDEVIHVPSWPPHSDPMAASGDAFIFRSGSYVTWGLNSEQSRRFRRAVIQGRGIQTGAEVERSPYSQVGDEEMEFLYSADQPTRIVGDVIVVGQAPPSHSSGSDADPSSTSSPSSDSTSSWTPLLARLAFSQGLSRSARLSVQEAALSAYLASVAQIPAQLEKAGKVPLGRKEVIRKMGTLLRQRQTIGLGRDNFYDEPEVYWENGRIEDHYNGICDTLDISIRFSALNDKLDHCENLLANLRALLTEASSHRMEVIIIALIALEATLALVSHGYVPEPGAIWTWVTDSAGSVSAVQAAHDTAHTTAVLPAAPHTLTPAPAVHDLQRLV